MANFFQTDNRGRFSDRNPRTAYLGAISGVPGDQLDKTQDFSVKFFPMSVNTHPLITYRGDCPGSQATGEECGNIVCRWSALKESDLLLSFFLLNLSMLSFLTAAAIST